MLYSYNQLKALNGKEDKQVIAIRKHLLCLEGNNTSTEPKDVSNKTLRAFRDLTNQREG